MSILTGPPPEVQDRDPPPILPFAPRPRATPTISRRLRSYYTGCPDTVAPGPPGTLREQAYWATGFSLLALRHLLAALLGKGGAS
jgi:hypothetical protein